ncbi:Hypothetical protein PHPALM_36318 [Phytophthora palmivora]|uniref:Uncharacterized protein n=1 Tax=Phytophthora palmivora TaxID=4796 RepID=A0A2P4X083_9STRA|nr:Hypothetical protein PHPALM_36318 [Phytophthora palmivora]
MGHDHASEHFVPVSRSSVPAEVIYNFEYVQCKHLAIPEAECIVAITKCVVDMVIVVNTDNASTNALDKKFSDSVLNSIVRTQTKMASFYEYFERTWVAGWTVQLWNVHEIANKLVDRANNPLQRFSRDVNARFSTPHSSMAPFLTIINQLSAEHGLQLADISRGSARRIRREVIELSTPVGLLEKLENTAEVEAKSN